MCPQGDTGEDDGQLFLWVSFMLLVHFMYTHAVSLQIVTLVLSAMAAGEASQTTPVQLCL